MKITIIGAGRIGGVLGRKWAKAGHAIRYGVRNPRKPEVLELAKSLGGNAAASTIAEAMDFGEVVLFAIPGSAMEETIGSVARALDGKIIIDAANKIGASSLNSQASFARHTPDAQVYRAFNSYGWDIFDTPTFHNGPADLFYAGLNGEPRSKVERLIRRQLEPDLPGRPRTVRRRGWRTQVVVHAGQRPKNGEKHRVQSADTLGR